MDVTIHKKQSQSIEEDLFGEGDTSILKRVMASNNLWRNASILVVLKLAIWSRYLHGGMI